MASPPETISDSSLNKPLIIPSEDQILKTTVIESLALNEKNQPIPITAGISKQINHIPERILQKPPLPRKNVPPCKCKSTSSKDSKIENSIPCTHEEITCTAQKYRKKEFNKCGKCSESTDNKIFIEFERNFREREKREEKVKNDRCQKFSHAAELSQKLEEINIADKQVEEIEKCKKCNNNPEKCQRCPFKDVLDRIAKEREAEGGKMKPSKKSGIKQYKENLKFSLGGVASNNQFMLSGVTLHTPITITPVSSEPEIDISAYDGHHHWSVTKFVPNKMSGAVKKIGKLSSDKRRIKKAKDNDRKIDGEVEKLFDGIENIGVMDEINMMSENAKSIGTIETIKAAESMKIAVEKKIIEVKSENKFGRNSFYDKKSKIERKEKDEKGIKKQNLGKMMKEALQEMAEEGYLFAKLPQCDKIPALQTWILYRKGFKISEKMKSKEFPLQIKKFLVTIIN